MLNYSVAELRFIKHYFPPPLLHSSSYYLSLFNTLLRKNIRNACFVSILSADLFRWSSDKYLRHRYPSCRWCNPILPWFALPDFRSRYRTGCLPGAEAAWSRNGTGWRRHRHFLRIFHRFSIIFHYLCRRFAALGNLKASFHCAHLQHLFRQIKEIKTTLR